ncbi:AMP-binding protein [Tabrizicola sp. J26]|uniref:AMP-binding protein n=1 Tax=Alitabrizicola rongguiensis TaxID=2909234 RepID=UPI0029E803F3|nr:AMP-binding protein [Tabrizicola rongguiensis]MCF1709316.1 AMP-binding protein [Tabrizicola rongguiensis]
MNEHSTRPEGEAPSVWRAADAVESLKRVGGDPFLTMVARGEARTFSGNDFVQLIYGACQALEARGASRGDVVAIWAPNSAAWIAAGLACHLTGIILAPLDSLVSAKEALEQASASRAKLLLIEAAARQEFEGRIPTLEIDGITPAAAAPVLPMLEDSAPLALFRTSGTTGTPKSFYLTQGNLGWNARTISRSGLLKVSDRVLMPLPMHHVYPWITAVLTSVTLGARIILPESPSGPHIAEALKLCSPTLIVGVPRLYDAMLVGLRTRAASKGKLAARLVEMLISLSIRLRRLTAGRFGHQLLAPLRRSVGRDLRMLISGGANLTAETTETLEAFGWDVRSGYGLAETAASVCGPISAKRAGSVGKPLDGCEIRIDGPGQDGVGEILLMGPSLFSGYLQNPEANRNAFTADGFFRTGDLGRVDKDGFLFITGRIKERIVLAGGDKIFPEDVERAYLAIPQIGEIGVLERNGGLVALVVPNMAEVGKFDTIDPYDAIRVGLGSVATSVPSTWRLSGFALSREPLPRTRLGKLRRFALPQLYEQALTGRRDGPAEEMSEADRAWLAGPPRDKVWEILKRDHGQGLALGSHMQLDLGLDSFAWMTLAVAIEESTGVRLEAADIAAIGTVRDLLERVSEKAANPMLQELDEARLAAEKAHWFAPLSTIERVFGEIVFAINRATLRLGFSLTVSGLENLPQSGPFVLCPNHVSLMDPSSVAAALPRAVRQRTVWAAARSRVKGRWLKPRAARALRLYPVDDSSPASAIGMALTALSAGNVVVWFPEGWRSGDGHLLPFHAGIGHVMLGSDVPTLPVFVKGTFEAWPRTLKWPKFRPVHVAFGPPCTRQDLLQGKADADSPAEAIAGALRDRLIDLARQNGTEVG